ncbi:MAG: hypothetical protein N3E47_03020 [Candidatus Bathyarchaeota archaeon]|nr:hypothetical protein [Candidatus Bathyarchaeota archaeon]
MPIQFNPIITEALNMRYDSRILQGSEINFSIGVVRLGFRRDL